MNIKNKNKLKNAGYFFHPGGDFQGELYAPKKRGIWVTVDSPVKAYYVGASWASAEKHYAQN